MNRIRYSANLGFLWTELPLLERVGRAAAAGFDAVECHYPYAIDPNELRELLDKLDLPLLSLNTDPGTGGTRDFGLAAMPDRIDEARALIDQAIDYALASGARMISVLAGRTGRSGGAEATFRDNLAYAAERAGAHEKTILIEPISQRAVSGYHLSTVDDALETIDAVGAANLGLMLDCYHTQIMEGDLLENLRRSLPVLAHVQMAAVHDRGEPDRGEIDFRWLLAELTALGYDGHVGAEYQPRGDSVESGLGWLARFAPL